MLSNNKIKYLKSLYKKKNRIQENKIVIEGTRIIKEAIKKKVNIEHIWVEEKKNNTNKLIENFKQYNIPYSLENTKYINSISDTKNSQGILALVNVDNQYNSSLNEFGDRVVVLDMISDPGNLGTIIRTCAWFSIDSLLLTEDSADIYNPKCVRSGMGAHFYMKHFTYASHEDIANYLKLKKHSILRADMNGNKISKYNISDNWALILGSEAHGINPKLAIGNKVAVTGDRQNIESLNVSIACGILLSQLSS